jgi:hypothetical protein
MSYSLLMEVCHTLRDLVYHFQCVDSYGISVAEAVQVLNEASPHIILADLLNEDYIRQKKV